MLKAVENADSAQPVPEGATIVCTLTGHGLKDPDLAVAQGRDLERGVAPEADAVARSAGITRDLR